MKRRSVLLAGATALAVRPVRAQRSEAAGPLPTAEHTQPAADATRGFDWPTLRLLDGSTLAPASWQGQAAVLVFWATYCPYCRRHNAHVDALHLATQGQPLRVLGVALDRDTDAVRRYMASTGYRFPVVVDGAALRQRFTTRRVIPMTCVLDRQGRLLQSIPGEMAESDVLGLASAALHPRG
jgi:thiol-disulfide isomerase/thioredoxin